MSGHYDLHKAITLALAGTWRDLIGQRPNASTLIWLRGQLDPEIPHAWIECEAIAELRRDCAQLLADVFGAPPEDLR